jgi:hypothetical protein
MTPMILDSSISQNHLDFNLGTFVVHSYRNEARAHTTR